MVKCKVCKLEKNGACTCGFCVECLDRYGHAQCNEISEKKDG